MARPFHDDLRRDSAGQCEADERATGGVRPHQFVLWTGHADSAAPLSRHGGDGRVDPAETAEMPEVLVHLAVRQRGEDAVAGERAARVFN